MSVLLWGFTAILGDLISLSALALVWWRVGLTAIFLCVWPATFRIILSSPLKVIKNYTIVGVLVALHWVCFFGAIKIANASVALITLATAALFTSLFEPLMLSQKLRRTDVLFGILMIRGMMLMISDFDMTKVVGFSVGIAASVLIAIFTVLNKKYVDDSNPEVITAIEMATAFVFLSLVIPFYSTIEDTIRWYPDLQDLVLLFVLSVFCTILPFVFHLRALKQLSAFTINLVINLEPVYGIILAMILLQDQKELTASFYLGTLIILGIVFIHAFVSVRKKVESKYVDEFH